MSFSAGSGKQQPFRIVGEGEVRWWWPAGIHQPAYVMLELGPVKRRRLSLPVHALLQNRRDAGVGVYQAIIPITLTTQDRPW